MTYMANWLAQGLATEDHCAPPISQAYRVGRPNNPTRQTPRDVIVTFKDVQVKNKILQLARDKGHLLHNNERVQ